MPSAWITHVKSVYAAKKKKNSSYTYGQAMKDAKATYKRGAKAKVAKASTEEQEEAAPKKRRRKKKSKLNKNLEDE